MRTKIAKLTQALFIGAVIAGLGAAAHAQLTTQYVFSGNGNMTISGVGSNNSPVGNLEAIVPVGSTVQQAFLFSSQNGDGDVGFPQPDVSLGSTEYSGSAWTPLGVNNGYEEAWVTNVTSQMQTAIVGGSVNPFIFSVNENSDNYGTDGEVLDVIYSNPADPVSTIAVLDGVAQSSGSTTTISYSTPLSGVGTSGFSEVMSIGDGYSYETQGYGDQYSTITVDGRLLTSSAGGQDDGQSENGALITVGGIGDSTSNPDPTANPGGPLGDRTDDELYDLGQGNDQNAAPFVSNGDTSTTITTYNSSGDDLIFFLGLDLTAANALVNGHGGGGSAPDSANTAAMLLLALGGLAVMAKRRSLAF